MLRQCALLLPYFAAVPAAAPCPPAAAEEILLTFYGKPSRIDGTRQRPRTLRYMSGRRKHFSVCMHTYSMIRIWQDRGECFSWAME
jgi:hypothetical protein